MQIQRPEAYAVGGFNQPAMVQQFTGPSRETCGTRYFAGGTIIINRTKKDKILCVLRGYRDFYFGKWDKEDENLLHELAGEQSLDDVNMYEVFTDVSWSHFKGGNVNVNIYSSRKPSYLLVWSKDNSSVQRKIKELLFVVLGNKPLNKYLVQHLLGYNDEDIKKAYEIKYPLDQQKFTTDRSLAQRAHEDFMANDYSLEKVIKQGILLKPVFNEPYTPFSGFPFTSGMQQSSTGFSVQYMLPQTQSQLECAVSTEERGGYMQDVFLGKMKLYFGYYPEDKTIFQELKKQYPATSLNIIIQNDQLIFYNVGDVAAHNAAQMLLKALKNNVINDYLYRKLQGLSESSIKSLYQRCNFSARKFQDDKKAAHEFMQRK